MNLGTEIWVKIQGFPNYEVSTYGGIRTADRHKPVNPEIHCKGYLRVNLFLDGKRYHKKVHRLVAEAFLNNPYNKPQVNHLDGNVQNNAMWNLEWVDDRENKEHQKRLREWTKS